MYLESLTTQIVDTLKADGLCAFAEFPRNLEHIPEKAPFVTAAVSALHLEPPISLRGGHIVPALCTLRFRIHGKPDANSDRLAAIWQSSILPMLLDLGFSIRDAALGPCRFDKTLDRNVREAVVRVSALIRRLPPEEESP